MRTKRDVSQGLPTKADNNQSRTLDVSPTSTLGDVKIDTNQQRTVGMFKASSDFDNLNQLNPFVGMESNPCGSHPTGKEK